MDCQCLCQLYLSVATVNASRLHANTAVLLPPIASRTNATPTLLRLSDTHHQISHPGNAQRVSRASTTASLNETWRTGTSSFFSSSVQISSSSGPGRIDRIAVWYALQQSPSRALIKSGLLVLNRCSSSASSCFGIQ